MAGDIRIRVRVDGAQTAAGDVEVVVEGIEKIGKQSEEAERRSRKLDQLNNRLGKLEQAAKKVTDAGDKMTKTLTLPLVAGFGLAIKAASDLGEAVNVNARIFGERSAEMEAAAKGAAEAVGLSRRAYLESTASLGGLLTNLGLAQEETFDWSQKLVTLAADLGSAFNVDPAEAVQAIGAALRGETEPIRRFNVMLDDQAIRAKAVELGLARTTAEVDRHGKAQGALALITEQTAAMQGDFADTADGAANASRTLRANVEDLAAELGENLLPFAEDALSFLNGMVTAFAGLSPAAQQAVLGIAGLVAGMGPLTSIAGRVVQGVTRVQLAIAGAGGLRAAMGSAATFMTGPWGIALAVAGTALAAFAGRHLSATERVAELRGELAELISDAGEAGRTTSRTIREISDLMAEAQQRAADDAQGFGTTLADMLQQGLSFNASDPLLERQAGEMASLLADVHTESARLAVDYLEAAEAAGDLTRTSEGLALVNHNGLEALVLTNEQLAEYHAGVTRSMHGVRELTERTTVNAQAIDGWRQQIAGAGIDTREFGVGVDSYVRLPIEALGETLRGFSNPIGAYTGLLAEKEAAEREAAEATAAATTSSTDSWEDYYDDVMVSATEWIDQLESQATAQAQWATNMEILATQVSDTTLDQLARMGPEGAPLVAELVNASAAELGRLDDAFALQTDNAIGAVESRIEGARAVASRFGEATVDAMTGKLRAGTLTVAQIANSYQRALASGVNPLLIALGQQGVRIAGVTGLGGFTEGFNRGGQVPGGYGTRDTIPAMLTRGEYVMDVPTVRRYGPAAMEAIHDGTATVHLNGGGFASLADVPPVPSVTPYSSFVGLPATHTMSYARDAAVEWLKSNLAPQLGPGIGWQAQWAALQAASRMGQIPGVTLHSAYRPGAITATGKASWHGKGRAVDITPSMAIFDWISRNYGAQALELIFSPAGGRQLHRGRPHMYSGITRANHWDHIHWAMANGGRVTRPGNFLVGENGPELMQAGMGDRVSPLDRPLDVRVINGLVGATTAAGTGDIHLHMHMEGRGPQEDDETFARRVGRVFLESPHAVDDLDRAIRLRVGST